MNCGCSSQAVQPYSTISCPNTAVSAAGQYPTAMGYVPWQQWQQTYSPEQGLVRGTIFPELDLPFVMGRYCS